MSFSGRLNRRQADIWLAVYRPNNILSGTGPVNTL